MTEAPDAIERRISPFFATLFYGFIAIAAWVWLDRGFGIGLRELWIPPAWPRDLLLGAAVGGIFAALTPVLVGRIGAARELEREFGWILGGQRPGEVVYLALVSGLAEELLFRGAMQRAAGPVVATLVFASIHWPVNRAFRLWPFLALAAGAVLAAEQRLTGALVAPAATHIVINLANLLRITRKYRDGA